jgi:hypothetical protein
MANEPFLAIFALFFMGQTILNVGCGSPAGCGVPSTNKIEKSTEDITFTEVISNKNEK